jgi:hypothetical protein
MPLGLANVHQSCYAPHLTRRSFRMSWHPRHVSLRISYAAPWLSCAVTCVCVQIALAGAPDFKTYLP